MADERDEREDEPKIRIVDNRMLSDEERQGRGTPAPAPPSGATGAPPKLEIVGGGGGAGSETTAGGADDEDAGAAEDHGDGSPFGDLADMDDMAEAPLTEAEQEQLRGELEQEQFSAIEQQKGTPLTEKEKDAVRVEMEKQAQSMASLEIPPMLQQLMAEMSARAAVHMGLMPNPYTRLIARNDTQARLAIDAFAAVLEVVRPHLDPTSRGEYDRVLNDLRVNFVSITGGSVSGPSRIIH